MIIEGIKRPKYKHYSSLEKLCVVLVDAVSDAESVRFELILFENTRSRVQKRYVLDWHERPSYQALRVCCGAGNILVGLRRFWAVMARRNSSFALHWWRNLSRPSLRMRLRCAKSSSTFLRSFAETSYRRDDQPSSLVPVQGAKCRPIQHYVINSSYPMLCSIRV